jgi:hypothetical protein
MIGHGHEALDDPLVVGHAIDGSYELHVQFHEIRSQSGQSIETSVAATEIIDGDTVTLHAVMIEDANEVMRIVDRGPLGNLEDDAGGR